MQIKKDVERTIHKYAIKNSMDYGKASDGSVLSKTLSIHPELKSDIKSLALKVKEIVSSINAMSKEEIANEYSKYENEYKSEEQTKSVESSKHDFSIQGAHKGNFVTRFPPEPGGYMHIGHAKPVFIEAELAKEYSGKLYLYFDDTNPDNERQEFVDAIKEDLKWLGVKFDKEYFASDYIPKLYEYAKQVIGKGKAYVCTCDGERIKENRNLGVECEHKKQGTSKNLELWETMLKGGFDQNEAILRLNSDIKSVNTTMRDPTLFRIKRVEHYRQGSKYFVWPTYDFCTPIVDSLNGITDVIRSKEYEMRDELYFVVLDLLGMNKPRITSISRFEIANNLTSKRKVRELIAEKLILGYDDPRLVTIRALKRRGIRAQAIKEIALSSGISKSESTIGMDMLLKANKRIVSAQAKHLQFGKTKVEDAVKCELWNIKDLLNGEIFNDSSLEKVKGFVLGDSSSLKEGDIVQFDKMGLYCLDNKKEMRFLSL